MIFFTQCTPVGLVYFGFRYVFFSKSYCFFVRPPCFTAKVDVEDKSKNNYIKFSGLYKDKPNRVRPRWSFLSPPPLITGPRTTDYDTIISTFLFESL